MKKIIQLILTTVIATHALAQENEKILPFKPDGCTANPDGNWGHCCYEHDYLYWMGGSFQDRKDADNLLRQCINEAGFLGEIAYKFVRSAGANFWNSAWPNRNIKSELTAEEKEAIELEKELWHLTGSSSDFEFIRTESILFPELSPRQGELVWQSTERLKATNDYKSFLNEYIHRTGRIPVTEY